MLILSYHGESDELHSLSGVAHFPVQCVDPVVPVGRVALPPLCADEVLEGTVEAGHLEQTPTPHVTLGSATTSACLVVVALPRTTGVPGK